MRHAAGVWLAAARGHCVKAIIFAGISALALGACTAMPSTAPVASPEAILAAPAQFRILTDAEVAAGQPTMAASGDVKTYVGDFLNWFLEPGHLIERSAMFASGSPPDMPEGVDFNAIVEALAEEGHPSAQLIITSGEPNGLAMLAEKGDATAKLAMNMNNIAMGSLQQKVDALTWFRAQAPTNRDAAFALGSTLLSQTGGGGDMMDFGIGGGAATPGEVREGAAALLKVAEAAPLDIMLQIGTMMAGHPGVDAAVDGHARKILELVVAATDATPLLAPDFGDDLDEGEMDQYLAYEMMMGELSAAVEARVLLAGMLAKGNGGPTDIAQATALYRSALDAMQDYRAYEGLIELGVDVSEYDALFTLPEGGEDWWNLEEPADPGDGEWAEEPEPAPPAHAPH
jgi:TPR repeat protein